MALFSIHRKNRSPGGEVSEVSEVSEDRTGRAGVNQSVGTDDNAPLEPFGFWLLAVGH